MSTESSYMELISGRRRGVPAALGRMGLRGLACVYGAVIASRNAYFDKLALPRWLEVPVISVGNLTVGGTGKTPMTLWLCRELLARGRKPAVLSRGYGAGPDQPPDELLLLSRRCPEAVAVAHADRFAAGQLACQDFEVQAAVLDDGFQHRRVGRDLDIVLIDATLPFGFGYILPRGLLRESVRGLARAEAVVITRCDQCAPADVSAIEGRVQAIHPEVPIVRAVHRAAGFVDLDGGEVAAPTGARAGCFAGIARPEGFRRTLADAGIEVADAWWWPDHHVYADDDVAELADWVRDANLDVLITTEKDAVKLARLEAEWPVPIVVLAVEIEMLDDGDRILADLIDTMLRDHEETDEPEPGFADTEED